MTAGAQRYWVREVGNYAAITAATLATGFGLFWLTWILWITFKSGFASLSPKIFTQMTPPPGSDGGLLNALYGSLVMIAIAVAIGTPLGVAAGTYLAEFARHKPVGQVIRFVNDVLLTSPSIVMGLFVYTLVVRPMGHFSGWAGGIALAFILLPVVVRTTDEMLKLVPTALREATLALGIPRWKMIVHILYRAALSGILTGVLLAIARISGETAPLLFTALNSQYWSSTPAGPMANIPVVIFQFAMSPYDAWHTLAWAGALVVTVFVLLLSITSRVLFVRKVPQ